jgi:hypothetical protein
MMKLKKLSTQTRNILLCVFSIIGGVICLDTYDITNFFYTGEDVSLWWKTRVVVFKIGALFLILSLKTLEGYAKLNVVFNCIIWVCVGDVIQRFLGNTTRDFYDWLGAFLTILGCMYEFRRRQKT